MIWILVDYTIYHKNNLPLMKTQACTHDLHVYLVVFSFLFLPFLLPVSSFMVSRTFIFTTSIPKALESASLSPAGEQENVH